MGTKGTISTRAMRKQCPSASLQPPFFFVMRPILVCHTQKRVWLSSTLEKPPSGLGEGVRFSLHRGPPRALYTGYGSMPT
jgi:hypothetical protein